MLNLAPAYFVVNYSDANCIVNKAATFLSFPISFIKCVGARSREPKWEAGLRFPCLASRRKGSLAWNPGKTGRLVPAPELQEEDVGGVMPHSLGSLHFSPLSHSQQSVYIPPARATDHGDILPGGLSWRKTCLNVA